MRTKRTGDDDFLIFVERKHEIFVPPKLRHDQGSARTMRSSMPFENFFEKPPMSLLMIFFRDRYRVVNADTVPQLVRTIIRLIRECIRHLRTLDHDSKTHIVKSHEVDKNLVISSYRSVFGVHETQTRIVPSVLCSFSRGKNILAMMANERTVTRSATSGSNLPNIRLSS